MKTVFSALAAAACFAFTLAAASAQPRAIQTTALQPRITAPIDNAHRVTLTGSRSPLADPAADIGAVPASTKLNGITLVFSRTPAQQAALDALILAQQTPGSPLYHQWLTPDQFAARFGVADADIAATENWLQLQGFAIDGVSRSRDRISFSGTAALVASAFGTPLHYFKSTSPTGIATTHFAPANDLTLPAALASSVMAVTNLSDFRPRSHLKRAPATAQPVSTPGAKPNFTSSISGSHFITPGDLATIYDITPAYNAGFTGANQSIAVVGQSSVLLADILAFQTGTGITAKTPQMVLMPGTGTSTIYTGDEGESDLDLEYTSTIAKGAQVFFVYTGSSTNFNVFDALQYAIDERIAPILSISYGDCETDFGSTNFTKENAILQQATAQGQTVVAASGDSGSTDCYGYDNLTLAQQETPTADFPSSSQYVTGLGGTEFPTADVAIGNNTYFAAQGSTDVIASALSYIPEGVWNDDAAFVAAGSSDPFSAGGGGISIFAPRPSWQAGTIGGVAIPAGNFRLTPDISLTASPINAPLAYCSSDKSGWAQGQASSCTDGLRDATTGDLTIAGGTSFDAPTFAGMLALIEQSINSTGEGLINPTLYTLAANATTYAAAFHDITSGGNQCLAGATYCSTTGTADYAATTGYDTASGLGSVDLYHLLTAWPTLATSALAETTTTLVAASSNPVVSTNDVITIAVAPVTTNAAVPTGTVSLIIDGAAATAATTLPLVNGVATYTFSSTTAETHIINATYSGDTVFAPSASTLVLNVSATVVGTFTLAVPNVSVSSGNSVTANLTITPTAGYTGTVTLGVNAPQNLTNFCVSDLDGGEVTISGTAPVTDTLTFYTSASTCNNLGLHIFNRPGTSGSHFIRLASLKHHTATNHTPSNHLPTRLPLSAALAGALALFGLSRTTKAGRRRSLLRAGLTLGIVAILSLGGLSLTACSSSETSSATSTALDTPAGSYSLSIEGADSVNANQTATAAFTVTVN